MINTYMSTYYGSFEVESNRIDQHYTYSKYDVQFYSSKGNIVKLSIDDITELIEEIATYVDGRFSVFGGKIFPTSIMIGLGKDAKCEFQMLCHTD